MPGLTFSEHRSLAEVALRVPQGIVCLLSALRVHDIGTQAPFEVWIAIPSNSPTPQFDYPELRVIRMSGPALSEGVESILIDGVNVRVFNAARLLPIASSFETRSGWTSRLKPCATAGQSAR